MSRVSSVVKLPKVSRLHCQQGQPDSSVCYCADIIADDHTASCALRSAPLSLRVNCPNVNVKKLLTLSSYSVTVLNLLLW